MRVCYVSMRHWPHKGTGSHRLYEAVGCLVQPAYQRRRFGSLYASPSLRWRLHKSWASRPPAGHQLAAVG
ncbi:hypothetical protein BHM03_00054573 [Ensete ventricosum]|nr:hypothetical protein BHM03_00054573 [Ensete ventricosum]